MALAVANGSTTTNSAITILSDGSHYQVSAPSPVTVDPSCAGVAVSSDPTLELDSTAPQFFVLSDTNGKLASTAVGCPVNVRTNLPAGSSTIQVNPDAAPANAADGTVGLNDGGGLTMSEGGCSARAPDVALGSGTHTVIVDGAGGTTLDLSLDAGAPLSIDAAGDSSTSLGSVGGSTGIPATLQFLSVATVIGPDTGQSTFMPGSATITLSGGGSGNTLDLSSETQDAIVQMSGTGSCAGKSEAVILAQTDCFSGIDTIRGSQGPTTFLAGPQSGITFDGSPFASNIIDESGNSGPLTIDTSTASVTSNGTTELSFSSVDTFVGAQGSTTFTASNAFGLSFVGHAGVTNTLDLSPITSAPTVNAQAGTVAVPPFPDDHFSNITSFIGSSHAGTTFALTGFDPGLSFAGQGTGNVLSLTGLTGTTGLTAALHGDSQTDPGALTSGSPGIDQFSGIQEVDGSTSVPTTFQPDPDLSSTPATVPLFVGGDSDAGGSVVDLSSFVTPDADGRTVTNLKLSLAGNDAADQGQVTANVDGSPVTFARVEKITTAKGSQTLPTGFDQGTAGPITFTPPLAQAITFTSIPPAAPTVGGSYTVSATGGGSASPVVFSVEQSSASVCTLAGTKVSFTAAGVCVIDADQAGTSEYAAASEAQQRITVAAPPPPSAAPVLSALHLGSTRFTAKAGTTLSVTSSEAATLELAITGKVVGHKVGRHCVAGAKKHAKRCSVSVHKAGVRFDGGAGPNRFALRTRGYAPGRYRVQLIAVDAGGRTSSPLAFRFTIAAPKAR